jgi:hypothetical protein
LRGILGLAPVVGNGGGLVGLLLGQRLGDALVQVAL